MQFIMYLAAALLVAEVVAYGSDSGGNCIQSADEIVYSNKILLEYNFGFTEIGKKKETRYISKAGFRRVDSVYISNRENGAFDFLRKETDTLPKTYHDEDSLLMILKFKPNRIGFFTDTLRVVGTTYKTDTTIIYDTIVTVDTLVNVDTVFKRDTLIWKDVQLAFDTTTYNSPILLRGFSQVNIEAWAANVKGSFMEDSVVLKVTAKNINVFFDNYLQNRKFAYKFKFIINADLFYPTGFKIANLDNSQIIGSKLVLDLSGDDFEIDGTEKVIAEISGKLLLAQNLQSQIVLSDFRWNQDWIQTVMINGTLVADGMCFSKNSMIMMRDMEPELSINPNPAGETAELNIRTTEKGPFNIEIYNLYGRKVKSEGLSAYDGVFTNLKAYNIDLGGLSSGTYLMTVFTRFYMKTAVFTISK
jgi:hypothetical protein